MKKDIFPLIDYDAVMHPETWPEHFVTNEYVRPEFYKCAEWYLNIPADGGQRIAANDLMLSSDEEII